MLDNDFCSVDNYSIVIPYRDFVKIVEIANNFEVLVAKYKRMEEKYEAMYGLYSEILEKVADVKAFVGDT